MQASCDGLPIWWSAAQVAQYAESYRKLEEVNERLARVPNMLMMDTDTTGGDDANAKPFVEAVIKRILDALRHRQRAQDTAMNNAAFALGSKIAGGWPHMIERDLKRRFLDACDTLPDDKSSGKPAWTVKDFDAKFERGMRDGRAKPDPWPPKGYNPSQSNPDFWRELFAKSEPVHGTLGEKYFLETRGVDPSMATLMRFHPAVSCSELGKGAKSPAIMTAYRTAHDAEPVAMHVTYVGTNGSKPALSVRKRTFGKFAGTGAALYFMPPGPRTITAEGIEKTLKGIQASGLPGIAAGSAAAMKAMALSPVIKELIILADRGEDGEQAADILARRAIKAGVKVYVCFPPVEGADWDECDDDAVKKAIEEAEEWEPGTDPKPDPIQWREPESIETQLYPVPAFDVKALLPGGLRDFVTDIAYRMCCPIEYPAVSAIVITASVIGANCAIRVKRADDWLITPNIWGAIIGLPSAKKSPPLNAALKPLDKLIATAAEIFEKASAIAKTNAKASKIINAAKEKVITDKIKAAAKDNPDDLERLKEELKAHFDATKEEGEPKPRRYKSNDPTIELVGEILRDNPGGILYVRDELAGFLASLDKVGREGDRQFYLEAWNGTGDFDTDRIGRGSIRIPNHCMTIFGGMTDDKLTAYLEQVSDALGNDGLTATLSASRLSRSYPLGIPGSTARQEGAPARRSDLRAPRGLRSCRMGREPGRTRHQVSLLLFRR